MGIHLKTDRILNLYDRLCQGQKILLKEEMTGTGASERSVKRDIAELRNYLESSRCQEGKQREIVYDRNEKCYYLIENGRRKSGQKEAYAAAKILLGSKGLSKGEMRDMLSFVLESCGSTKCGVSVSHAHLSGNS